MKLTTIKIKYDDGTYSDEIPISVLSENVEWDSTHTLVDVLGSIDVDVTGTIQNQISQLFNEKISASVMQDYVDYAIVAIEGGSPTPVSTVAEMIDESAVYLYTGSETDESTGYWYSYDPTQEKFVPRGVYGGAVTDTTLSISGKPADAKAVGDALAEKADSDDVEAIKAIISGLVVNESALSEFIDNTDIDYAYDEDTGANYTVIRIYKHKIDGSEQYPFVYAPNGAGSGDKSTLELMQDEAWMLAINAGIFDVTHCTPDGMVIQNGSVIKNAVSTVHPQCKPLTIDTDGNLGYAVYDADASTLVSQGIVSAVCGFIPIIIDYDPVPQSEWNAVSHYTENAQRQIIGQFGNGDYAIVTCEGRGFNNSDGWTLAEAQTICQKIGLKFAYNLDGGGSTETMIGKYPVNLVYERGTGRKVPTFIVFNGKNSFSVPSIKRVTGITLLSHSGTVKEGEGLTVEAVVSPTDATDKSIIWTSSDPAVAVVSDGRITGMSEGTATITATTSDGGYTDTFAVTVKSSIVLPTGYTRIQYVQADGQQYIDTGIVETSNLGAEYTYSVDADSTYGTGNHVLSSRNYFYPFVRSTSDTTSRNLAVTQRGQGEGQEFSFSWTLDTIYTVRAFIGSNIFSINGTQVGTVATGSNLSSANNLYLFAYGGSPTNAVYRFKGKLYGMTLYNAGGTVVHRYVPCKNPNDVAGLYDVVAQQFLHSDSGTELIAGAEIDTDTDDAFAVTVKSAIVLPAEYKRVQYVQANGNQYINTGIAETANLGAEYTYSIDADSTYGTGNHVLSSAGCFYPFLRSTSDTTDRALLVTQRGQGGGQEFPYNWSLDTIYTVRAFVGNNDFSVNGTKIGTLATGSSLSASNMLYLFAYGGIPANVGYRFNGKLYGMTLYNAGGTVVHRYVPCKNPNDVAGLYDVVAGQFLHSDSGTELIAGAEIDTDTDDDIPAPESNVLLVTVTMSNEISGMADKSYAEVIEAWNAGKVVRLYTSALGGEIDITARGKIGAADEYFMAMLPIISGSQVGYMVVTMIKGATDSDMMSVALHL